MGQHQLKGRAVQAAQMLGGGMTAVAVASELKCSPNTVANWLKREDFRALRDAACREIVGAAVPRAIRLLMDYMDNDSAPAWVRLQAVDRLLRLAQIAAGDNGQTVRVVIDPGLERPGMPPASVDLDMQDVITVDE